MDALAYLKGLFPAADTVSTSNLKSSWGSLNLNFPLKESTLKYYVGETYSNEKALALLDEMVRAKTMLQSKLQKRVIAQYALKNVYEAILMRELERPLELSRFLCDTTLLQDFLNYCDGTMDLALDVIGGSPRFLEEINKVGYYLEKAKTHVLPSELFLQYMRSADYEQELRVLLDG